MADIIGICSKNDIPGYMVTMDIKKAFDSSLDLDYVTQILEKVGFGENFKIIDESVTK